MRAARTRWIGLLLGLGVVLAPGLARAEHNLFEWVQTAPIVVVAKSLGDNGRYHEMEAEAVFRGDPQPGELLRVDLKFANRDRRRNVDPRPLRMDTGRSYLVLLERWHRRKPGTPPFFRLVRGVRGARQLPEEGAQPVLDAVRTFVEIQDLRSDRVTWDRLSRLLEERSPLLIQTSLEQFVKFRRGRPKLLPTVRPLLDHPDATIRRLTAVLTGQILGRHPGTEIPEAEQMRAALIGHARRDTSVEVRVEATTALDGFGDEGVESVLREIADSDPDQLVRYTAEKLLLMRRRRADRQSLGAANR